MISYAERMARIRARMAREEAGPRPRGRNGGRRMGWKPSEPHSDIPSTWPALEDALQRWGLPVRPIAIPFRGRSA